MFLRAGQVRMTTLAGMGFGFLCFGILCDKFGRYRMLLVAITAAPLTAALGGLAFTLADFLLLRFLAGALAGGLLLSGTLLAFESLPAPYRLRTFLIAATGGMAGLVSTLLLETISVQIAYPRGSLPYAAWRLFFMGQIAPLAFVLPLWRYHDEPRGWKRTVRDVPEERARAGSVRGALGDRPRLIFVLLLLAVTVSGVRGWVVRYREYFGGPAATARPEKTSLARDRLIAYLVRYPSLLDMKEAGTVDLAGLVELWRGPVFSDPFSSVLLEGILALHESKRSIDTISVADKGLERWNALRRQWAAPSGIPLTAVDSFFSRVEALTLRGNESLAATGAFPTARGAAELWTLRMETLKALVRDNQAEKEWRYGIERRRVMVMDLLFLFGGLFGVLLIDRNRGHFDRRRSLPYFFLAASVLSALSAIWGWKAGLPSLPDREILAGRFLCLFLAGFLAWGLMLEAALIVPGLFRTPVRGTSCGLALAGACCLALALQWICPGDPARILGAMLCFVLGFVVSLKMAVRSKETGLLE